MSGDDGTAFHDKERQDSSGKRDIYFNRGKSDGSRHGHVVESTDETGNRDYNYVRDVDGNVYKDDTKPVRSQTSNWVDPSGGHMEGNVYVDRNGFRHDPKNSRRVSG